MTDYIVNALTGADLGAYFVTLIVSMIPVIELRGAIPLGVGLGLSHFDGDDGDESSTEVFTRYPYFAFLQLFGAGLFAVFLHYGG